ncbi:porin [Thioalkalivibrio sp. ALJ16]|uniref:porin n=1 Tax=Thioalkalivibrio sp. ALJ16 TaxID=1158762 RepID=UPI00036C6C33|nr:porin [Thioalkalivibrio sp. ALJ16]
MKKQILAVAVAGAFAVPAFAAADTNVTLFGQIQSQAVYDSVSIDGQADPSSELRIRDAGGALGGLDGAGPNQFGVNIRHDLGNGLTAIAKIEQDFTVNGSNDFSARDRFVGLSGDFGTVRMGRMATSYTTAGKDPLNATFMQGRLNGGRVGPFGGLGNGSYLNDTIAYSNSFGMVSLVGMAHVNNGDNSDSAYSARLNFDLGDIDLYAAYMYADDYASIDDPFDTSNDPDSFGLNKARLAKLGVDWSSGPFRLVGEYENVRVDIDGLPARVADSDVFFLSGTYTMGRNDFVLNLGHTRNSGSNNNTDYVALGMKHNFSNRVMAFAGVAYTDQDNNSLVTGGLAHGDISALSEGEVAPAGSTSTTQVGAGLRVSF